MVEYHSQWDRRLEGDILPGDHREEEIHLRRRPHGVVASICPWNSPLAVFARKLGPALVTGNTMVAKPSELTPLANIRAVELIDEHIDLPDGVLNLVTGSAITGQALVNNDDVDMISMTGHRETGKQIMRDAADNLNHVSLELGGKAPAIVCSDADIEESVKHLIGSRTDNCGQYCTAVERVYVDSSVAEEFTDRYVEAAEDIVIGRPDEDVDLGPQVAKRELDKTETAVEQAKADGATVLTGGKRPDGFDEGYYYEPTVITDIKSNDLDIMQKEVFGPVLPIMEVDSLEQAIEFSNDSRYGLSAYLFTNDYEKVMRVSNDIDFGELYINRSHGEAWHAHHPGWNESGMGGDDGKYGMLEFTKVQTVYHNY
jgi:lactaldehyde dehydrogenase/glycolaldehyde dehydrogenase